MGQYKIIITSVLEVNLQDKFRFKICFCTIDHLKLTDWQTKSEYLKTFQLFMLHLNCLLLRDVCGLVPYGVKCIARVLSYKNTAQPAPWSYQGLFFCVMILENGHMVKIWHWLRMFESLSVCILIFCNLHFWKM